MSDTIFSNPVLIIRGSSFEIRRQDCIITAKDGFLVVVGPHRRLLDTIAIL
jgi:hypothetical protein